MDPRFSQLFSDPQNAMFSVVFFPDRIYHPRYFNATRSSRYRYEVREVRSRLDILVIKAEVYLDSRHVANVVRIEYGATRLIEQTREKERMLGDRVRAWVRLAPEAAGMEVAAEVSLHRCRWIDAWQVELWSTLDAPTGLRHDYAVLDQMGADGPITEVAAFSTALSNLRALRRIQVAFREAERALPPRLPPIQPVIWDNNFFGSHQEPRTPTPSAPENTVSDLNYELDFRRGWYLQSSAVQPVRYVNAMMDENNPDRHPENVIEMRWILQRELGGSMVFFHEVTIPPGKVEGTHWHIGSEELYYITEGEGTAYMAVGDDPDTGSFPIEERQVFGVGKQPCRALPVRPGSVIYTKSGGVHGIRNPGATPLKFVAFLYHSA